MWNYHNISWTLFLFFWGWQQCDCVKSNAWWGVFILVSDHQLYTTFSDALWDTVFEICSGYWSSLRIFSFMFYPFKCVSIDRHWDSALMVTSQRTTNTSLGKVTTDLFRCWLHPFRLACRCPLSLSRRLRKLSEVWDKSTKIWIGCSVASWWLSFGDSLFYLRDEPSLERARRQQPVRQPPAKQQLFLRQLHQQQPHDLSQVHPADHLLEAAAHSTTPQYDTARETNATAI